MWSALGMDPPWLVVVKSLARFAVGRQEDGHPIFSAPGRPQPQFLATPRTRARIARSNRGLVQNCRSIAIKMAISATTTANARTIAAPNLYRMHSV